MNHVKFMFNRINNYDLLYEDIMEGNQEWGENTKRVEDHTKAVSYTHLDVYKRQALHLQQLQATNLQIM